MRAFRARNTGLGRNEAFPYFCLGDRKTRKEFHRNWVVLYRFWGTGFKNFLELVVTPTPGPGLIPQILPYPKKSDQPQRWIAGNYQAWIGWALSSAPTLQRKELQMRWTRTHSVFSMAAVACAALAYWGLHLSQGEESLQTASVAPGAEMLEATGRQVPATTAPGATERLSSCRGVSPFVKNANCFQEPEPDPNVGPPADGTAMMLPQFEKVYAMGLVGEGVVAKALRSAGRAMAGTSSNNDSVLVDVSATATDAPMLASITQALDEGKFVIIDGGDTRASSDKLNEIMADINLLKVEGVTAYAVVKAKDGSFHVTPLQSLAGANGERQFDQLHNVLGINKPGFGS